MTGRLLCGWHNGKCHFVYIFSIYIPWNVWDAVIHTFSTGSHIYRALYLRRFCTTAFVHPVLKPKSCGNIISKAFCKCLYTRCIGVVWRGIVGTSFKCGFFKFAKLGLRRNTVVYNPCSPYDIRDYGNEKSNHRC